VTIQLENPLSTPSADKLLAVIRMQAEITKLGMDLNAVMNRVAEQALAITPATGAVVEVAEGDDMVYRAVAGAARGFLGLRAGRHSSLSGLSVTSSQVLRCDDSETDPRVNRDLCREVGLRSMVVVPLVHQGEAVGVLKVYSDALNVFGDADVQILSLMADLIAAAMYNATKYSADGLFRLATTDSLTGIANRALFFDRLRSAIAAAKRERRPMGVLMIDVDGLKWVNDTLGHRAGDAVIREAARRLHGSIRATDTAARLGGDEFGAVLTPVADRAALRVIMDKLAERFTEPLDINGRPVPFGASMGGALYPDDATEPELLLEKADQAMYAQKSVRKGRRSDPPAVLRPAQ
jgi:diguanylate cyclase (GGDEF)-like protein